MTAASTTSAWDTKWVQDLSELHRETLPQKHTHVCVCARAQKQNNIHKKKKQPLIKRIKEFLFLEMILEKSVESIILFQNLDLKVSDDVKNRCYRLKVIFLVLPYSSDKTNCMDKWKRTKQFKLWCSKLNPKSYLLISGTKGISPFPATVLRPYLRQGLTISFTMQ